MLVSLDRSFLWVLKSPASVICYTFPISEEVVSSRASITLAARKKLNVAKRIASLARADDIRR